MFCVCDKNKEEEMIWKWDIIGKRRGKEMVFRFCELHVCEHNNGSFYLRQRGKRKM